MPGLCDCFGRAAAADRDEAYKAGGPDSDALPGQVRIPSDALELGATRDSARQQDDRAGSMEQGETKRSKKDKDGGGQEEGAAVGSVADSGVPTIVVINARDEETETGGGLDTEEVHPEIVEKENTTEQAGAAEAATVEAGLAAAAAAEAAGDVEAEEDAEGDNAVLPDLEQLGKQVLKECGTAGAESAEGLADFMVTLASGGAEGAIKVLENFGPVGPLFKCLGVFMHFVSQVKAARSEGERLRQWAATLIPIIRQSVPTPFPADVEKSKQEELTQCTQQAIEAIEALQEAIGDVAKSKGSWKRFFTAGKYIERMTEAKTRVETAVDIIQRHLILDTKSEVLKITAMLKAVVWGPLTDMSRGVAEVKSNLEAGFAELRREFQNVRPRMRARVRCSRSPRTPHAAMSTVAKVCL